MWRSLSRLSLRRPLPALSSLSPSCPRAVPLSLPRPGQGAALHSSSLLYAQSPSEGVGELPLASLFVRDGALILEVDVARAGDALVEYVPKGADPGSPMARVPVQGRLRLSLPFPDAHKTRDFFWDDDTLPRHVLAVRRPRRDPATAMNSGKKTDSSTTAPPPPTTLPSVATPTPATAPATKKTRGKKQAAVSATAPAAEPTTASKTASKARSTRRGPMPLPPLTPPPDTPVPPAEASASSTSTPTTKRTRAAAEPKPASSSLAPPSSPVVATRAPSASPTPATPLPSSPPPTVTSRVASVPATPAPGQTGATTCIATLKDGTRCYVTKNINAQGLCRLHARFSDPATSAAVPSTAPVTANVSLSDTMSRSATPGPLVQGLDLDVDEDVAVDEAASPIVGSEGLFAPIVSDPASHVALEVRPPRQVPQYQFRLPNHVAHVENLMPPLRVHEGSAEEDVVLEGDEEGLAAVLNALPSVYAEAEAEESEGKTRSAGDEPESADSAHPEETGASEDALQCHCHEPAVLRERAGNARRQYYVCANHKCDFLATRDVATALTSVTAAPRCRGHQRPCKLSAVKREGANHGRLFWSCAESQDRQCKSFQWLD